MTKIVQGERNAKFICAFPSLRLSWGGFDRLKIVQGERNAQFCIPLIWIVQRKRITCQHDTLSFHSSGWHDSNVRPLGPKPSILPTVLHPECLLSKSVAKVVQTEWNSKFQRENIKKKFNLSLLSEAEIQLNLFAHFWSGSSLQIVQWHKTTPLITKRSSRLIEWLRKSYYVR